MNNRRSAILLLTALLGIVVGFWFYGLRQKEVVYQDLTILEWLEKGDAATPLKALGTNLLPMYIDVLKGKRPLSERLRIELDRPFLERLSQVIPVAPDEGRHSQKYSVLRALSILECQASPAMPHVFNLLRLSAEEEPDLRVFPCTYKLGCITL